VVAWGLELRDQAIVVRNTRDETYPWGQTARTSQDPSRRQHHAT